MRALLITGLSYAAVILLAGCATTKAPLAASPSGSAIVPSSDRTATATAAPTAAATASPAPTSDPTATSPATATPEPTVAGFATPSPAPAGGVSIWIADYRPEWIGYIGFDGQLVKVVPNDRGGTTVTRLPMTYQKPFSLPHGPDDKMVYSWSDNSGKIETTIFVPGTPMQFNALLTAWQQILPCAVGVQYQHATIVFTGTDAHAWCVATTTAIEGMESRTLASAANMDQVCTVQLVGAVATVRDTGLHDWGNGLCSELQSLGDIPAPSMIAGIATFDAVSSLKQDTQRLQSLIQELGKYPSEEQTIIEAMKQHLQKEQKDAAVRPMTSFQANVIVSNGYNVTLGNDSAVYLSGARQNLKSRLADLDTTLSDGNKQLTIAQQSSSDAEKVAGHAIDYAQAAIAAYQSAASDAQKQKTQALATDADVSKTAQGIMAQGKAVLDTALAAVQH